MDFFVLDGGENRIFFLPGTCGERGFTSLIRSDYFGVTFRVTVLVPYPGLELFVLVFQKPQKPLPVVLV